MDKFVQSRNPRQFIALGRKNPCYTMSYPIVFFSHSVYTHLVAQQTKNKWKKNKNGRIIMISNEQLILESFTYFLPLRLIRRDLNCKHLSSLPCSVAPTKSAFQAFHCRFSTNWHSPQGDICYCDTWKFLIFYLNSSE